ncbi:MAG: nucleotidyltransferase domain-containing protein [Actinomycetota bacterium]|nr:nucleotidyltransferase domain-containing protein [Actinomycetota bacterium]
MLSVLVTSAARRKLLTRFLTHPGERFYLSQLIRDLDLTSSSAQKELGRLTAAGLLTSEREGNTRYYAVNIGHPLYPELKAIIYKTEGLGDLLRECLADIQGVEAALVYGSVPRNVEDVSSDVDLLVIGHVSSEALDATLSRAEALLGREVTATVLAPDEWRERADRRQAFAVDVLENPKIFIVGGEDDLR